MVKFSKSLRKTDLEFLRNLPLVDAHHHFWDLSGEYSYPWLMQEPRLDFRYGDYAPLRRSYLPEDYARDTRAHKVVKTVHVEAEFDPADPARETRWLAQLHAQYGRPNACVAQAWFDRSDIEAVLAAQAVFPLVKSIRHKPAASASPAEAARGRAGSMDDPRWRRGYALLERHRLHFDLQTPCWHLPEAADLARDFPQTTIIINHTALPPDRSEAGLALWRRGLEAVARYPNVCLKISGLGLKGGNWPSEENQKIVQEAISIMGYRRCMFASNFPVDSLCADFDTIFSAFKDYVAHFPYEQIKALFHDNAVRIYGLA